MEDYNNTSEMDRESHQGTPRGNFLYASPSLGRNYCRTTSDHSHQIKAFQLQSSGGDYFPPTQKPTVKTEVAAGSTSHHATHHAFHHPQFPPPSLVLSRDQNHQLNIENESEVEAIKAKIISHPHYSNLLQAYVDCQRVGAPSEVTARLSSAPQEFEAQQRSSVHSRDASTKDPELDQFMEAYCHMLNKYREELTRPIQEAKDFMKKIEAQLNMLGNNNTTSTTPLRIFSASALDGNGSSEDDQDHNSGGETEAAEIDPRAEDRELKNHLLRKYSGYLSSLKQELSKKKKKGKLPEDARQKLLSWWEVHYKWPYPSESEKMAWAESTGLDHKQINNWFINQRKRHWKPSEDMQFMVMDGLHQQNAAALYMGGHYIADGHYRLGP